jgi:hypothetical protein
MSAVGVWRAALCQDWSKFTSVGEGAVAILLGADKKRASILRRYCEGLVHAPQLAPEVVRTTNEVIEFKNGSALEIITNDARLVRGRSAIAVRRLRCHGPRQQRHSDSLLGKCWEGLWNWRRRQRRVAQRSISSTRVPAFVIYGKEVRRAPQGETNELRNNILAFSRIVFTVVSLVVYGI